MLKTLIAASTILIAVSGVALASTPITGVWSLTSTSDLRTTLDAKLPTLYADNESDDEQGSEDDNDGADDNDDTGCTAAKSHDKYTICHG